MKQEKKILRVFPDMKKLQFAYCGPKYDYRSFLYSRPDNSAKDNSANLKFRQFRQFSQNYADNSARDNSANNSDSRSRANMLRACHQRVGLYTKDRAGYRRVVRPPATLNREISPIPIFFFRI